MFSTLGLGKSFITRKEALEADEAEDCLPKTGLWGAKAWQLLDKANSAVTRVEAENMIGG